MSKKARRKKKFAERMANIEAKIAAGSTTAAAQPFAVPFVERPFAGFAREVELVAMRELLPAATLKMVTTDAYGAKPVTFVTMLPRNAQALIHEDGTTLVALNTRTRSGNAAHDLAVVLEKVLEMTGPATVEGVDTRTPAAALTDIIDPAGVGEFQLHRDFEFWLDSSLERTAEVEDAIAQSREGIVPMGEVPGAKGAYWAIMNAPFLRWILGEDEDAAWDALARLQAANQLHIGEGTKFIGAFRACGLVAPVFEMPTEMGNEETLSADLAEPVAALRDAYQAALQGEALNAQQRRARAGLVSRQVSLR
ncbi:MAG: DUF5926 family protein [Actinomycetaceae bacterium]|nr:DUF5926 family protein [Actinomycetaceae bacterium]